MHSEERVAVGVTALYLANIATLVLNTVFLVLLTNWVPVEEVGFVTLLNLVVVSAATVAVLALPVSGTGLTATPPAVTRFLAEFAGRGTGAARRVYVTSAAICGVVSVAAAAVVSYAPVASAVAGQFSHAAVFVAAADAVAYSFAQLGAYSMLGAGKAPAAGKLMIASSAVRYASAAALLVSGFGPTGIFVGFIAGDALQALLGNASAFRHVSGPRAAGVDMKPVTRYMTSVLGAALVGLAVSQTDKVVAFLQGGHLSIALYNVASVGAAVASFAPAAATNVLVPALSSYGNDPEKKRSFVRKYTRYVTLVAMPMGLGLAALSPFLLQVFGSQYASAAPVLAIISVSIGLSAIVSVYASILLVDDKAHLFTYSSLIALAALVVVAVLTVPSLGLNGVALGRAAMVLVMLGAVAYFVKRSGMLVLDAPAYVKSLAASGAMAAFIYGSLTLAGRFGLSSRAEVVSGSAVMMLTGLLVYVLAMKLIGGFSEDDMDFVDALVPRRLRFVARLARKLL